MLKLLIAGVDQTPWLANGYTIECDKVLSTETLSLALLDLDVTEGSCNEGDDIVLARVDALGNDIELIFGGEIATILVEPIIDDMGTVTRIRCRDRMYLADQVFVPPQTLEVDSARPRFKGLVDTYLGPKGVTVISAPTGGPLVPQLRIDDPVTTLREVLDRHTLWHGWPWRINGEFDAGIIEPGELPGPATLSDDGQSVLTDPPLRFEKERLTHATRVWVHTSAPETGPGPIEHTEEWTADGVQAVYPVHVLPSEIRGSTSASAEAFDATLTVTGLPREATIRVGARLSLDWHKTLYTVAATVSTDIEGAATITLIETLERDVPEGHPVVFRPGAFVQLELDGVVTPMDGVYVWDPVENAIVSPGVAFPLGTVVRYRTWVLHPLFVREWDASAQTAIGWFDYSALIDQQITEEEGHTTIESARAFGQSELARRLVPPKRVSVTTRIPGHYPLLSVPLNFPDRGVVGTYLCTEVRIRHSNIDENGEVTNSDLQPLLYELVLMQGDAIGESWVQYFRGRNPSLGIRWESIAVRTQIGQYALEVGISDLRTQIGQFALEVGYTDPDTPAVIGQWALEVAVTVAGHRLLTSQGDGVSTSQGDHVQVAA